MTRSGFVLVNPTKEQHRAIFKELTKGAKNPETGRTTILDADPEDIKAVARDWSRKIHKRDKITRRPHQDDMDGQWQFLVNGVLFDGFATQDDAWVEWDSIMDPAPMAAE